MCKLKRNEIKIKICFHCFEYCNAYRLNIFYLFSYSELILNLDATDSNLLSLKFSIHYSWSNYPTILNYTINFKKKNSFFLRKIISNTLRKYIISNTIQSLMTINPSRKIYNVDSNQIHQYRWILRNILVDE